VSSNSPLVPDLPCLLNKLTDFWKARGFSVSEDFHVCLQAVYCVLYRFMKWLAEKT